MSNNLQHDVQSGSLPRPGSPLSVEESRSKSRCILNQLTPGERFWLMFGYGRVEGDPPRVVPIKKT